MKHDIYTLSGRRLDQAVADLFGRDSVDDFLPYRPSTEWVVGGPILYTYGIGTMQVDATQWRAMLGSTLAHGATPLIAGMRVLLLQHHGSHIEIEDDPEPENDEDGDDSI